MLELSYAAKIYDLNESNRETNTMKLTTHIYKEDSFLKNINIDAISKSNIWFINSNNMIMHIKEKQKSEMDNVNSNLRHKRQDTHINLNFLETKGDSNNKRIILDNMFSSTIQNMNNTVKARIRRNNSCKEIRNTEDNNNTIPSTNSSFFNNSNNVNNNKKPLCYIRAFGNKEKKLIEFTK